MVKVSEVDPPTGTLAAPKALIMPGGETTVTVAVLLVAPAPLSLEEIAPVVFALTPAVVPVTFTLNVHDPLAASVAPDKLTLPVACVAVIVPPPQLPVRPLGVATTRPEGRLSLKAMPVSEELAFGLLMVKLSEVDPFSGMLAAPNDLLMVGGNMEMLAISHRPRPWVAARSTWLVLWIPISNTATRGRPVP